MLIDWSILTPILIAVFTAVGVFAFNDFKTFEFYVNYFYIVTTSLIIFILGWNFGLLYSDNSDNIISWWLFLSLSIFLIFVRVIFKISETKHYKSHTQPW